ncbi:MAG: Gfo/Idh/MocA family oxidoreductase [Anaerolineae bacterium]|nr:Gfo/Idh/MocA family oxidoreductase [Anaerolineae bacterium]
MQRVALIGTGAFASTHVEALHAAGERVRLVAAVNTDVARGQAFCQQHGIPACYADTATMLHAEQPDLVHICTPPGTHAALSMQCLAAGAHVLCEKPLCASLAEFDRLLAAEAASGRTLSTVFQWRFGAAAQFVQRLLHTGEVGRPLLATCHTLWYREMDYYAVPWRGQWAASLGGTTMGHGIHLMDLLLWLLGDWQEVQAIMRTFEHPIEVENVSLALVTFASGAVGSIANSAVSPRQETHLRLDCQQATLEVKALYRYDTSDWAFTLPGDVPITGWRIPQDQPGTLTAQVAALLDSLEAGQPPLVSGWEARRVLEFITGLYQAARTGSVVRRADLTPDNPFYHSLTGQPV